MEIECVAEERSESKCSISGERSSRERSEGEGRAKSEEKLIISHLQREIGSQSWGFS